MNQPRLLGTFVLLFTCFAAHGTNGFFPAGNGVIAHGMGGAGLANGSEAMSMVDNPALLNRVSNLLGVNVHFYYPELSADIGLGYTDSELDQTITPLAALTQNINETLDWGLSMTLLGGAGSDYPATLLGESAGITAGGVILAPSISYAINSESSVGLSLQYAYETIETDGFTGGFGDNDGSTNGYGFKVGYVTNIAQNASVAVTYQSKIDVGEIDEHCSGTGMFAVYKFTGGDCSLDMPQVISVGIAYQLIPEAKLVADIQQINWEGVDVIKDVFGWEDRLVYKIGGEYNVSPQVALRAGYNYSESPMADNRVADNIFAGAIVESHYTLGMSYMINQDYNLSAYYSHGVENDVAQSGAVSNPSLSPLSKIQMSEQVLGVSLDMTL